MINFFMTTTIINFPEWMSDRARKWIAQVLVRRWLIQIEPPTAGGHNFVASVLTLAWYAAEAFQHGASLAFYN